MMPVHDGQGVTRRRFCLMVAAALPGSVADRDARAAGDPATRRWLSPPAMPDVPLLDQTGRTVRLQRDLLAGRTVIVNFMFTGCQAVCPIQTALLLEASRRLQERPETRDVLMISITVDPLADGPEQLRAFGERHGLPTGRSMGSDQRWVLLTGQPADVARVLAAFEVPPSLPGAHPSQLWLGDAARVRWTRTSSLDSPDAVVSLVKELRR